MDLALQGFNMKQIPFYLVDKLFKYNPETGIVTRKISRSNRTKKGQIVGSKNKGGYLQIFIGNDQYLLHRVVWCIAYKESPKGYIDHINGVRTDNRLSNLRVVTKDENARNVKRRCTNNSGITGVHRNNENKNWRARIYKNKKCIELGSFLDKFEAICARKSAEIRYGYHKNHGMR